jgi:hypothetical protein
MSFSDDYDFHSLVHWTSSINYPFDFDENLPLQIPTNFTDLNLHQEAPLTSLDNASLQSSASSPQTFSMASGNSYEGGNNLDEFDAFIHASLTDDPSLDASKLATRAEMPGYLDDL